MVKAEAKLALLSMLLVAVEVSILLGPEPLRLPAGLILALTLPGLVIAPLISGPSIEGTERLLFVPGISVITLIATGLLLDAIDVRLTTASWAIALGLVTAAGLVVTMVRHLDRNARGEPVGVPGQVLPSGLPVSGAGSNGRLAPRGLAPLTMLGAAMLILLAALAVVAAFVVGDSGERYRGPAFTELWALPGGASHSDLRLGVISHQTRVTSYRVVIAVDAREIRTVRFSLRPGHAWQTTQVVSRTGRVDVWLERGPRYAVYRHVELSAGLTG